MATFGVPFAMEDAPRAAVNAAIDMHNRIEEYNSEQDICGSLPVAFCCAESTGIRSSTCITTSGATVW